MITQALWYSMVDKAEAFPRDLYLRASHDMQVYMENCTIFDVEFEKFPRLERFAAINTAKRAI